MKAHPLFLIADVYSFIIKFYFFYTTIRWMDQTDAAFPEYNRGHRKMQGDRIYFILFTHVKQSASQRSSAYKETHTVRENGVNVSSCIHVTALLMTQITWADSQSKSRAFAFKPLCVRTMSHPVAFPSSTFVCGESSYIKWFFDLVEVLHDQWPIYQQSYEACRCHGVVDAESGWRLANESSHFRTKRIRELLELFFKKAGNSLWDLIEL